MAMTPRFWTINAQATELERDRRTIAKKLAHVRPTEVVVKTTSVSRFDLREGTDGNRVRPSARPPSHLYST